jgi:hypothetical protein
MQQNNYVEIIKDLTERAIWEVQNVIDCVPDEMWERAYCNMPLWKHIYHMLHSLDKWYINPYCQDYEQPAIHEEGLDNLDFISTKKLTREEIYTYFKDIKTKLHDYLEGLKDEELLEYPENCPYTKFTLILGQFRHLHSHMGMIMGFIIEATGNWPRVLGLEHPIPEGNYEKFC